MTITIQNINLNRKLIQNFPFHLVAPSPWPIFVSFALLNMAVAGVMYMHGYPLGNRLLTLGSNLTFGAMILWFKDICVESDYEGAHTKQVQKGLMIGFLLFIVSEVFAFLSIFWGFFHSSLSPAIEIGGIWPPQGITALDPFAIPLLNTMLLVSSGAFVTYGHHALINGNRKDSLYGTLFTIILAIVFSGFQYFEYSEAPFSISDSVFGSAFYASTGLHGFHVIIGTLFITIMFFRNISNCLTQSSHLGFETSILYWHFVDIVWLFLFIAIYYWGRSLLI
uniref:cytochrome c oxidase subunit 3 n=1 Tax=Fomitopsis dickinsii TaxID=3151107 RepID=UPI002A7F08E7|nr:cytochrome c oxidase subunit 3 [Daedalea dickinsii]WNZ34360.1 cytochrome c oxidase subunit 3 [Daedalea dickinsii]